MLKKKRDTGTFEDRTNIRIDCGNIFDYEKERNSYELEGVLPGQVVPTEMLDHVPKFAKAEGIVVITTASGISLLSETCRRSFQVNFKNNYDDFEEQIRKAKDYFKSHLKTLGTQTRRPKDLLQDNILHEYIEGDGYFCDTRVN